MSRRRAVLLATLTATVALAAPASAAPPTREPLPAEPITAEFCAGTQVSITTTVNREMFTTFSDGRGLITGTYKAVVTNLETGESIPINASGPIFFPVEGSSIILRGRSLLFFEAGERGPGSPPALFVTSGVTTATFDDEGALATLTTRGKVRDLCAELAA